MDPRLVELVPQYAFGSSPPAIYFRENEKRIGLCYALCRAKIRGQDILCPEVKSEIGS